MTLTLSQARDAVIRIVDDEWKSNGVTSAFQMQYDNVKSDKPGEDGATTQPEPWGRTTVRIITAPQTTQGRRRFETTGSLTVQVFTPFGDGHELGDQIVQVLLDILRAHVGDTSGLWFFGIVPNEIGQDGPWFQTNVSASFRYQELAP